jgi:hypothetical protein
MAMRRITNPNAAAAPTPAAPTPAPAAQPVAAVLEPPAPALPAQLVPPELAAIGAFTGRTEGVRQVGGGSGNYLAFYRANAKKAQDVTKALGGSVGDGTPYLVIAGGEGEDGAILPFVPHSFTILREFAYNVKLGPGPDFEAVGASLKPRDGYKEQLLTVMLVLPSAQGQIDPRLAPATVCVTTWRSTKTAGARGLIDAIEATTKPEWLKKDPLHGSLVQGGLPPRFRVAGTLKIERHTARSGFAYETAEAVVSTVSMAQVQAIGQWLANAECQAELKAAEQTFDRLVAEVRELAGKTQ